MPLTEFLGGNVMASLPDRSFAGVVEFVASLFIIFGGMLPFIPQYLEIKRSNNAEGFSTFVCFTLLIANILRIWFWFGHPFEMPLFLQSLVMIAIMLAMIHICTVVKSRSEIIPESRPKLFAESESKQEGRRHSGPGRVAGPQSRFLDMEWSSFWKWSDFESYLQCLGVITLTTGVITYLLLDSPAFIETLGFMAVFFEAMLGAPQFYRNFCNKSTQGMSLLMVLTWTLGDMFKTIYFVVRSAPAQFYVCGAMQVSLDFLILLQVLCYWGSSPVTAKKTAIQ